MRYLPIATERLKFRLFTKADYDELCTLDGDADIMRYIGKPRDAATVRSNLNRMIGYYGKHPGLGSFVTEDKASGMFMGWTCLKHLDSTDLIEVGYRYLKQYWGQGIATEATRGMINHAHYLLKVEE